MQTLGSAPRLAPVHFAIHGRFITSFRVLAVVRATAWLVLFATLGYYQVSFQGDTFETSNSGCIPRVTIRHIGLPSYLLSRVYSQLAKSTRSDDLALAGQPVAAGRVHSCSLLLRVHQAPHSRLGTCLDGCVRGDSSCILSLAVLWQKGSQLNLAQAG